EVEGCDEAGDLPGWGEDGVLFAGLPWLDGVFVSGGLAVGVEVLAFGDLEFDEVDVEGVAAADAWHVPDLPCGDVAEVDDLGDGVGPQFGVVAAARVDGAHLEAFLLAGGELVLQDVHADAVGLGGGAEDPARGEGELVGGQAVVWAFEGADLELHD